ncbi:MAG: NAD(+) synthase, partial [Nitrospinota bacterium]
HRDGALCFVVEGNKSEISTGYCTLYGDMAGGFAVIKDVPKMLVYALSHHRNTLAGYDLIPDEILQKEPSAELRPDQKDTDSLPPYPVLDKILSDYVEKDKSLSQIVSKEVPPDLARKIIKLVDFSEYKRRQAAPGVKITPRAFGKDRRFPLVNHFRD